MAWGARVVLATGFAFDLVAFSACFTAISASIGSDFVFLLAGAAAFFVVLLALALALVLLFAGAVAAALGADCLVVEEVVAMVGLSWARA
ncbi:hypothetical protein J1777_13935 [Comamonas denitrificans]|uniref:Uncharacterized protein n=1 Tax=Comamonas denitrificans TaxID=117506 RepID=A0A939GXI3_9BURK|nr:hypothetical protein [Comamonas denitrificans]MBO1250902.1 hypothetical protein [Comamonas denitrificans]